MTRLANRVRIAALLALASITGACASAPPDLNDSLVVPGERVGPVVLGMPLSQLIAVAGTPRRTTLLEGSAAATYEFDGFSVAAHDTVYWIIVDSPVYRTAQGAAVGAEQIEARSAFGRPECVVTRGDRTIYDYRNLYVEVANATGRVTKMGVQKRTGTCE